MTRQIRKVTVLGSGVMGRGIAAQLANAGIEVNLLDILPRPSVTKDDYQKLTDAATIPGFAAFSKSIADLKGLSEFDGRAFISKIRPQFVDLSAKSHKNVAADVAALAALMDSIEKGFDAQQKIIDTNPKVRNTLSDKAVADMRAAKPLTADAAFMDPNNAKLIKTGNYDDHLSKAVAESDWVVEVVLENLKIKRDLFAKIDSCMRPGTVISSNTSSIPLKDLVEGRSDEFTRNFLITHFFNPPRFMKLMELISGPQTDPSTTKLMREFCDIRMGKNVVECNDSPAFIANRIGSYFIFRTLAETLDKKIPIQQADAVLARPLGLGKDGIFKTLDMVGLTLIPHLTDSLKRTLPADDAFLKIDEKPAMKMIGEMLSSGRVGRMAKDGKGGFYRAVTDDAGKRSFQVLDTATGSYIPSKKKPKYAAAEKGRKGAKAVFEHGDKLSHAAWVVMRDTILYTASLVPTISSNIADIDAAMRDGYNWKKGTFQLLDEVGIDWFLNRARKDGVDIPKLLTLAEGKKFYRKDGSQLSFDLAAGTTSYSAKTHQDGVIALDDIKKTRKPLLKNSSAALWDIGDGVVCFEITSKMGSIDPTLLYALNESIKLVGNSNGKYKGMVIHNTDPEKFSVGANIGLISAGFTLSDKFLKYAGLGRVSKEGLYDFTENLVFHGQSVYQALHQAPFPVVGAPSGLALGGGCEILMHCSAVQAHSETYTALVEAGVGFIPGWGGCARMLERAFDAQKKGVIKGGPMPPIRHVFANLAAPFPSGSAQDARNKLWLPQDAGITMNPYRLLGDAKSKVLSLAPGYQPPKPFAATLPGRNVEIALRTAVDGMYENGNATYHDLRVTDGLAKVLTGNSDKAVHKTLSDILHDEREVFLSLLRTEDTPKRIAHMLSTGGVLREKPLSEKRSVDDIRADRIQYRIRRREITGRPLEGFELAKLKVSAEVTNAALRAMLGGQKAAGMAIGMLSRLKPKFG